MDVATVRNPVRDATAAAETCRRLYHTVADVLGDEAALARECDRLLQIAAPGVVAAEAQEEPANARDHRITPLELQAVTQRLIDRLGCRQLETLERVTAVYTGFVNRNDGVNKTEFRGYIACVLTQLQRELASRCVAATVPMEEPTPAPLSTAATAAVSPCVAQAPTAVPACEHGAPRVALAADGAGGACVLGASSSTTTSPKEPLSELQLLTLEFSGLKDSFARIGQHAEATTCEEFLVLVPGEPLDAAEQPAATAADDPVVDASSPTLATGSLDELRIMTNELDVLKESLTKAVSPVAQTLPAPTSLASRHAMPCKVAAAAGQADATRIAGVARGASSPVVAPANSQAFGPMEAMFPADPAPSCQVVSAAALQEVALAVAWEPPVQGQRRDPPVLPVMPPTSLVSRPPGAATLGSKTELLPQGVAPAGRGLGLRPGGDLGVPCSADAAAGGHPIAGVPGHRLAAASPWHWHGATAEAALPLPRGDVPPLFREPSTEEVQELLEMEGLPALVAFGGGRGFVPKRLCLDGGGGTLYILDAEASVPAVFLGIPGFSLRNLRRVLHGAVRDPAAQPLLSLEFQEGFLPARLGDAAVLRGFLRVLQGCVKGLQVVELESWS